MTNLDRPYLEKQALLYLKVQSLDRKNDLLYRIGTNVDVLTPKDIIAIQRNDGWLTQRQRQQVINFISKRLKIDLDNWVDFSNKNQVSITQSSPHSTNVLQASVERDSVSLKSLKSPQDLEIYEALVQKGVFEEDALLVVPILNKMPRSLEEQDLVTKVWVQLINFLSNEHSTLYPGSNFEANSKLAINSFAKEECCKTLVVAPLLGNQLEIWFKIFRF